MLGTKIGSKIEIQLIAQLISFKKLDDIFKIWPYFDRLKKGVFSGTSGYKYLATLVRNWTQKRIPFPKIWKFCSIYLQMPSTLMQSMNLGWFIMVIKE